MIFGGTNKKLQIEIFTRAGGAACGTELRVHNGNGNGE